MGRAKPWFRIHNTIVDNPKIQMMPENLVRPWLNLIAVANGNGGVLPSIKDIAFKLRSTPAKVETLLWAMQEMRLFDKTDDGLKPHDWDDWQFQSDSSTERVQEFRKRHGATNGNVTRNVSAAAAETDQRQSRAETEQNPPVEDGGRKRPDRGTRLPSDWTPNERNLSDAEDRGVSRADVGRIAEHFRDHHHAKGTVSKSWDASWRTWLANEKRFAPKGRVGKPAGTDWDGAASDPQSLGQMAADVRPARHGGRIIDAEFSVAAGPSPGEPGSVSASRKRPETVAEGLRDSERGSRGGAEDVPDHAWSSAGRPAEPRGDADHRHLEMGSQTAAACGHSGDSERGDVAPDTVTVPCADSRPQSPAVDDMPDIPDFLRRRA